MMDIHSRYMITRIVPALLGLMPDRQTHGVYMTIDARLSHWGKKTRRQYDDRTLCHMLFRAPHSITGGINSFYMETEDWTGPTMKNFPWEKFENVSNHDSCWSDAIQSKLHECYFRMADRINVMIDATSNRKKIAPIEMHQFNVLDHLTQVELKLSQIHDPKYGNLRYKVEEGKHLKNLQGY